MRWLLLLLTPVAFAQVESFDYVTKYGYTGEEITISWCHDDPAVTFVVEIVEFTSDILVFATTTPDQTITWVPQRIGHHVVRVKSKNDLAVHGNDLESDWTQSNLIEGNPPPVMLGCSNDPPRNFWVYADIRPPDDGGIE